MYQFRHPTFSVSCKTFGEATARGEALQSLAATDSLRHRFFAWRGASGRRYVCSVFQSGEDSFIADVTNGVIIGVAREGAISRPVCVFLAQERAVDHAAFGRNRPNADNVIDSQSLERALCDRRALRKTAQELGVAEWHVHFCADAATLRDLSASLLN
ncbi:MAG: hypothetical protein FJX40_06695 [Alphaproteobacteria bacterium]|nr:hypothetical protein [Alphaproteobacteria bacterium]